MINIGTQKPQGKSFAINIAQRNAKGEITRYKYYEADTASELSDIWEKNNMQKKNKNNNKEVASK